MRTVMIRRFKIPCSKDSLKAIRSFVSDALNAMSVPDIESNMLVLAVDEICANRIVHSNSNNQTVFIEVVITNNDEGSVVFEIIDSGEPFINSNYVEPNLLQLIQDKKKGGLGLMLVHRIMDSVEVNITGNVSVFRMQKKLSIAS